MSNSALVNYTAISPYKTSPRNHKIDTITIHCMAGDFSVETCGNIFQRKGRNASSNYGIGSDGRIGLYVDEKDRSWCSSNRENDMRAITIEVANDGGSATGWHVTDKALESLINLLVDICQRNAINALIYSSNRTDRVKHLNGCNMTLHRDFAAKACPGDYLVSKHPWIAEQVNARLNGQPAPTPSEFPYKVKIICDSLNVRKGAGVKYPVVMQVHEGQVYTIVAEDNGWGKLKSGAGWICLKYTKKV